MTVKSRGNDKPRKLSLLAAYLLLGVVLAYLSPYLLGEEGAKRSMASLTAPFVGKFLYPEWAQTSVAESSTQARVPEGVPRPPITLALVTDDDLKAYGETYPLPYGFHADRLDSIASRNPSAIFVDVAFLDERPDASITSFVQTLCEIGQGTPDRQPIPLFLASLEYLGRPLRNELKQAGQKGCFQDVAVPRLTDQLDRNNWQYALQVTSADGTNVSAMDSPALALYKALNPGKLWLGRDELTDLALVWGMNPHTYNPMRMRDVQGQQLCRDSYDVFRDAPVLGGLMNHWFGDDSGLHGKPFCPYHASMPLYFLSAKTEVADTLLSGRVVIYAVDLQSVGDYVYSPLHGAIPGAYVHAMALDNLLRFEAGYPRALDFDIGDWTSAATVFPLIMITLVALGVVVFSNVGWSSWFKFEPQWEPPKSGRFWRRLAALSRSEAHWLAVLVVKFLLKLSLTGLFLLAIGWVAFNIFDLGIFSWLEYAMLPMLLATFQGGHRFATYIDHVYDTLCPEVQGSKESDVKPKSEESNK